MGIPRWFYAGWVLIAVALAGCGGGSSSGGDGNGTLRIAMVDAPAANVKAVHVTIDRVEAHINNEWLPVTSVPQEFDLLELTQKKAVLGSAPFPAGRYTQVRFFPSAAWLLDSNDQQHPVEIPSAAQTGVKVNVHYTLSANQVTTILLDFNAAQSIVLQGNGRYQMKPVVRGVVEVLSGTITGSLMNNDQPVQGATVTAVYAEGTAYPIGTEVNTSVSGDSGAFKIWALLPGKYTLKADHTDPNLTATRTGVEVNANLNTEVGVIALQ